MYYCNTTWGPDEKGETKFITQDDLGTYETKDFEGNIDPLIVSVAPVRTFPKPLRSNINIVQQARSSARFVPLKFVEPKQRRWQSSNCKKR